MSTWEIGLDLNGSVIDGQPGPRGRGLRTQDGCYGPILSAEEGASGIARTSRYQALCESRAMESRVVERRRSPGLSSVLACFRGGTPDLGVSDIARILDLKTSTTHRLIRTLVNAGFLERDPRTSRYRLGNALAEYGQIVYRQRRVYVAEPHVRRLSQATGENVALAVRHGSDALLLTGAQAAWSESQQRHRDSDPPPRQRHGQGADCMGGRASTATRPASAR